MFYRIRIKKEDSKKEREKEENKPGKVKYVYCEQAFNWTLSFLGTKN